MKFDVAREMTFSQFCKNVKFHSLILLNRNPHCLTSIVLYRKVSLFSFFFFFPFQCLLRKFYALFIDSPNINNVKYLYSPFVIVNSQNILRRLQPRRGIINRQ